MHIVSCCPNSKESLYLKFCLFWLKTQQCAHFRHKLAFNKDTNGQAYIYVNVYIYIYIVCVLWDCVCVFVILPVPVRAQNTGLEAYYLLELLCHFSMFQNCKMVLFLGGMHLLYEIRPTKTASRPRFMSAAGRIFNVHTPAARATSAFRLLWRMSALSQARACET